MMDDLFHTTRDGRTVRTVHSNVFHMTPDRSLDRLYLRTCAVYRLLKSGRITREQALEISNRPIRKTYKHHNYLRATIELWRFNR